VKIENRRCKIKMSNVEAVCADTMFVIFSHLTLSELVCVALTCKRWYDLRKEFQFKLVVKHKYVDDVRMETMYELQQGKTTYSALFQTMKMCADDYALMMLDLMWHTAKLTYLSNVGSKYIKDNELIAQFKDIPGRTITHIPKHNVYAPDGYVEPLVDKLRKQFPDAGFHQLSHFKRIHGSKMPEISIEYKNYRMLARLTISYNLKDEFVICGVRLDSWSIYRNYYLSRDGHIYTLYDPSSYFDDKYNHFGHGVDLEDIVADFVTLWLTDYNSGLHVTSPDYHDNYHVMKNIVSAMLSAQL